MQHDKSVVVMQSDPLIESASRTRVLGSPASAPRNFCSESIPRAPQVGQTTTAARDPHGPAQYLPFSSTQSLRASTWLG
jgi:hypothetical protein